MGRRRPLEPVIVGSNPTVPARERTQMKKIYIAKTKTDEPASVILADNKHDASIAFSAMKIGTHEVEEIDPSSPVIATIPVIFLLTSIEANSRDFSHRIGGVDFRVWKRGL